MGDKWGVSDAPPKMADNKGPAKLRVRRKTKIRIKKGIGGLPQEIKVTQWCYEQLLMKFTIFAPEWHVAQGKNLLLQICVLTQWCKRRKLRVATPLARGRSKFKVSSVLLWAPEIGLKVSAGKGIYDR